MTEKKRLSEERTIRKGFRFNAKEAERLAEMAKLTGLSEARLVRALINGYEPKPHPGKEFWEMQAQFGKICDALDYLAGRRNYSYQVQKIDDSTEPSKYNLDDVLEKFDEVLDLFLKRMCYPEKSKIIKITKRRSEK